MKKNMNKVLVIVLAVALLAMTIVAGTLAYLMMATESVTNTFTIGNVAIELVETKGTWNDTDKVWEIGKIIPGQTAAKDPKITVGATSENCWVFVKIEQTEAAKNYITFSPAADWEKVYTSGDGLTIVYALKDVAEAGENFPVFADNQVTFNEDVTKTEGTAKIILTGYAIQETGFEDDRAGAYGELQKVAEHQLPVISFS